jgi:hypothetical protein
MKYLNKMGVAEHKKRGMLEFVSPQLRSLTKHDKGFDVDVSRLKLRKEENKEV